MVRLCVCLYVMFCSTVCVQIFTGFYFHEFCKSTGVHENTKICTHTVQDCSCRLPFAKLILRKLLGAGCSQNIRPVKICTHTVFNSCLDVVLSYIIDLLYNM